MKLGFLLGLITILLASVCTAYRTNSDICFESTDVSFQKANRIILNRSPLKSNPVFVGDIEATVKKLTLFHQDPTNEQANLVLAEKAQELGADAVLDVSYKKEVGFFSWSVLTAKGKAVNIIP